MSALVVAAHVAALEAEVGLGRRHLLGLLLRPADRARPLVAIDRDRDHEALVVIGADLLDHPVGRRRFEAGLGGLLTDEVIDALDAKAVCGPANNPLADHSGAARLAGRGILYAPDFVVNAGGVIYLDLEAKHLGSRTEIMERVGQIGDTVRRIFDEAESRGVTPLEAAEGLAAERLAAGGRQPALAH